VNITQKPISELTLDPKNARKHSDKNLKAIAASLEKFGQRKPIVVQKGVVLAGNGTLEAAKSLGWTEIAIAEVPDEWDLDTAKAYALADNRSAELAEWDEGELAKQLLELQDADWDITELGFEVPLEPDFEPVDENPRLDQKEPKYCPNCNFEITNV
jgi:ParB-like chromosome segregation protein Spo0J